MARVWLWAAILMAPALADEIVLVSGGEPRATIVVQADAKPTVLAAAEDLRHYVRRLTGVDLPLSNDGTVVEGAGLYIGVCEPSLDEDPPAAEVGAEGEPQPALQRSTEPLQIHIGGHRAVVEVARGPAVGGLPAESEASHRRVGGWGGKPLQKRGGAQWRPQVGEQAAHRRCRLFASARSRAGVTFLG